MNGRSARIVGIMAWTTSLLALAAGAATPSGPAVGAWAAYRWTSSVSHEVPVVVRQEGADGRVSWSVSRESTAPRPLFVTFGIVGGDAGTYTLQIVTSRALDGPPLSVTQLRVDRGSGKALRSVIRTPKGVTSTPDDPLRPFRTARAAREARVVGNRVASLPRWASRTCHFQHRAIVSAMASSFRSWHLTWRKKTRPWSRIVGRMASKLLCRREDLSVMSARMGSS